MLGLLEQTTFIRSTCGRISVPELDCFYSEILLVVDAREQRLEGSGSEKTIYFVFGKSCIHENKFFDWLQHIIQLAQTLRVSQPSKCYRKTACMVIDVS